MSFKIILSDDVHVNARNFDSMFRAMSSIPGAEVIALNAGRDLWNRYGDYAGIKQIEDRALTLEPLTGEQLRSLTVRALGVRVNAFDIARSEMLSYVLAVSAAWYNDRIINNTELIFDKFYSENPAVLRLNIAAVLVWADIYSSTATEIQKSKAAIVFSGSQIYQRLILEICKSSRCRAFVIESFQTGTEYYFEERYSPITAGSEIKYRNVEESIVLPEQYSGRTNEINKAQNKLINSENKNVTQPKDGLVLPYFENDRPTLLLAAQVQNDFSLIESQLEQINPLQNYKDIISGVLGASDLNVIVKTHPWERRKTHLRSSFTFEHLGKYVAELPPGFRSRVALCEDANIVSLLDSCDVFVTQTSQSAFEACYHSGLKPFVIGAPFYGQKGFTHDFSNVSDLVGAITSKKAEWSLSLEEFDQFLLFLTKLLQFHLPSVHQSGIEKVRTRLLAASFVEVGVIDSGSTTASATATAVKTRTIAGASGQSSAMLKIEGRSAFNEKRYAEAESNFIRAFEAKAEPKLLRAAAEAAEMQGMTERAVGHLARALAASKNPMGIKKRMSELNRPKWLRRLFPERPYPVGDME